MRVFQGWVIGWGVTLKATGRREGINIREIFRREPAGLVLFYQLHIHGGVAVEEVWRAIQAPSSQFTCARAVHDAQTSHSDVLNCVDTYTEQIQLSA